MKFYDFILTVLIALTSAGAGSAQHNAPLGENAALRYWAAFAEVQDSGITAQQAKKLNAILDGTTPYDDSEYKDVIEKNTLALDTMARGTAFRNCDWGLDYGLGSNLPVDYARKALVLGRLNVLYAFHLLKTNHVEEAVHAMVAGLRFSQDVANGGSLFATLVANNLFANHLRAVVEMPHLEHLAAAQRSELQSAIKRVGGGFDWPMAAKRDLEVLRQNYASNSQEAAALDRIIPAYVAVVRGESKVSTLNHSIEGAPRDLANLIPKVEGILKQKQNLSKALQQTRSMLQ